MNLKASVYVIVILLGAGNSNMANAVCCYSLYVNHPCDQFDSEKLYHPGSNLCQSKMCMDGLILAGTFEFYCGIGSCNIFGCNCDGGCRTNSLGANIKEAKRIFISKYNVTSPDLTVYA